MSIITAPATDVEAPELTKGVAAGGNVVDIWRGWVNWGAYSGWVDYPITWSVINANSTVLVAASEIDGNSVRFLGAAPITVANIVPAAGIVTVRVNVAWSSGLRVRTDLVVFN
ncbi:hypothetical protein [Streptomyces paludis]|uniref:Uncharacterized protein n=1 Tax=Streptomyces paludis TaxID=2282738 RepID=A0A345HSK5_9ACTN|nr:hypothetical protein [Streptomyces paludis]AXG79679.1 hypothetical protein DVK44_20785 [Streptomyces paludis]